MSRRPENALLALFWVLLLSVYAVTISTSWKTPDVTSAEAAAWKIAHTGEPWVDGVTDEDFVLRVDLDEHSPDRDKLVLFSAINESNGHAVITRTPGAIAVAVPAYWIQAQLDGSAGETLSPIPGALTAAVLTTTAVLLLMLALRDLIPFRLLVGVGLAVGLATPYWSLAADALWTHSLTILAIAGMAWAARHERWWLVGVFGGVGLSGRMHVVLIVALLGLGLACWRRRPRIAVTVAATSVPFLLATFIWGRWMYGVWDLGAATGGYGGVERLTTERSTLGVSNLLGYLVSPGGGLFVWTPVLLILVPAVVRTWRRSPDWTRLLTVSGVVYLVVQAALNVFDGGNGFWGNRLGLETLTCAVPLVGLSLLHLRPVERIAAVTAVTYQAAIIAPGAVFDLALSRRRGWKEHDVVLALSDNAIAMVTAMTFGALVCLLVVAALIRAPRLERASPQG